jgi:GNAT superfamily N-acetyltransferase
MYVAPEHRGLGVNKRILEGLESWSAARGVNELKLEVYIDNVAAIRAYEKAGYSGIVLEMQKRTTKS